MSQKVSLQKIIDVVLEEKGMRDYVGYDSIVRSVRRGFDKLLESLGGSKEELKDDGRKISFDESDVPFMKVIIEQLYEKKGMMANFLDEGSNVSSTDVRDLIMSIIEEESERGVTEDEISDLALFLLKNFSYWSLSSMENCHYFIDVLAANLHDLTSAEKALYFCKVEHIIKKEVALRIAESTIEVYNICKDNVDNTVYCETDPEIRFEYIQRDKAILAKIEEDNDLRYYIEKKLGKKAEEIFKYANLG